jgi:hypothetical protein
MLTGLCIDDTYFHGRRNPFLVCFPPSFAAALHISVAVIFLVVKVGLWSSLNYHEFVDVTQWRLSSAKYDDDNGTPGNWLMHGLGTTPTQDPELCLKRDISPLPMECRASACFACFEVLSCTPSFLNMSTSPPSPSHSYTTPFTCLLEATTTSLWFRTSHLWPTHWHRHFMLDLSLENQQTISTWNSIIGL